MGELLREIPEFLRPYEKAEMMGVEALDDAELLAMILRTGTAGEGATSLARRLLKEHGGRIGALKTYSKEELMQFPGIGPVKALQILSVVELSQRFSRAAAQKRDMSSPASCAEFFMEEMCSYEQEVVKAVYLDGASRFIKAVNISVGAVNETLVPAREVFINALKARAVFMILMHNHPSGDPEPSQADIQTTFRIRDAGKLTGILLLDHLVIGDHCYVSLHERGLFTR